ncbi:MAG: THUMP domain-containing protein [Desulfurococcales archaeon]|nr:THUMP domain-containing protein [Desulfurococcales archaeon]
METLLVRYGELAVKGPGTRGRMERLLVEALSEALDDWGGRYRVKRLQGRIIIELPDGGAVEAAGYARRVFGVKSLSPAWMTTYKSLTDLIERALEYFAPRAKGKTFRVRARRSMAEGFTSKDVERLLGERLLQAGAGRVNLEHAEYTAYLEIRGDTVFLYDTVIPGPGGLPPRSEDPVLVLFSGGFDSTVAAWRIMRRGSPVQLAYYDLGSKQALDTAIQAARELARLWGYGQHNMKLHIVDFKPTVTLAAGLVDPRYRTLVIRRLMLEHAVQLAKTLGIEAIATGDSIGQVASQTIRNLYITSRLLDTAILRPLAGTDKDEVMQEAQRIGLYHIVSKQVEPCAINTKPTTRANPEKFHRELEKLKPLPPPETKTINLKQAVKNI